MLRSVAVGVALSLAGCGLGAAGDLQGAGTHPVGAPPVPDERALTSVPPLTGGTLIVTHDGLAVASDPERDLVWVVDLSTTAIKGWLTLEVGSEPGRLVEDGAGRVHVALRRGGALVTFDPRADKLQASSRRAVCAEPRGVTLDPGTASVVVACATGELVWAPVDGSAISTRLNVGRDLRDVLVQGDKLVATSFRSATLVTLDRAGTISAETPLPTGQNLMGALAPSTAWRTIPVEGGNKIAIVHHRSKSDPVQLAPLMGQGPVDSSPYGSDDQFSCPTSIVDSAITVINSNGQMRQGQLTSGSLPIDVAVDSTGFQIAVVTASPGKVSLLYAANVNEQSTGACSQLDRPVIQGNEPVAVAWSGSLMVAQTRAPAGLTLGNGQRITFPVATRNDRGFSLFHAQAGAPLACASCHAEGRDDGRVWQFNPDGVRRTQVLSGGLLRTSPFHWDGSLSDIGSLMNEVFVHRMGGHSLSGDDVTALAGWLDKLPAAHAVGTVDPAAVQRGQQLFESPTVACSSCHSGERFTNNQTVDVGTGQALQVPSLTGVSARGPWMHTGCAKTLRDRFDPACGGGDQHGGTSQLSPSQLDDLVAYMQTL